MSDSRLVAIIDSNFNHLSKVERALTSFYNLKTYENAATAMRGMKSAKPAVILLSHDLLPHGSMPSIREIHGHDEFKDIPIIYIAHSHLDADAKTAKEAGASKVVVKPYTRSVLVQEISGFVTENVEKKWQSMPEQPRKALMSTVDIFRGISDVLITGEDISFSDVKDSCQSLVDVVEGNNFNDILDGVRNHDDYTYAHSMRVATLLTLLGHAAGFSNDDQLILSSGGLLHDVGKMTIPHNILNKPGKLTDEEFEIMKTHVPATMDYLNRSRDIPKGVKIIAEQHHEKLDGTGYPHGLKGKELNELARMSAIVDVFSALTDRRVYKEPMESAKAMTVLEEMTNHLDQHYVKMFKAVLIDTGVLK